MNPAQRCNLAWQQKEEPTRFIHLFRFKDANAQALHGQSDAVKQFEGVYSPELVGGDVVFTDYEIVAGKLPGGVETTTGSGRRTA